MPTSARARNRLQHTQSDAQFRAVDAPHDRPRLRDSRAHPSRSRAARRDASSLALVGSAARDDFDPSRSDIDVLVDFPDHALDLFGASMGLRENLAEILGRPVDVITLRGVRNPPLLESLLLESLLRDAVRLYAA